MALGGAAACALLATPSHANPWTLQAAGTVIGAWSDNLANAPEVAEEGEILPQAGFYTQLQPSGLFTFESPRAVHAASAVLDVAIYQTNVVPNATNFTLAYRGLLAITATSELGLDSSLAFGDAGSTLTAGAQDAAVSGASRFRTYTLGQSFRWQATRDWRLSQNASFSRVETDTGDGTNRSHSLGLQLSGDRAWARTSLGLNGGATFLFGADVPGGPQLAATASVNMRRDIDPRWSASASAGITTLTALDGGTTEPGPALQGTLNYLRPVGPVTAALSLAARKRIEPNLFLQTITDTTGVTLTGSIPLPWLRRGPEPTMQVSGSLGLDRSAQLVGGESTWHVYRADTSIQWSFHESAAMALRYQYVDTDIRVRGAGEAPPVEEFFRHTIMVQVSGRFPESRTAGVPDRTPLRVDRANETPLGQDRAGQDPDAGRSSGGSEQ